jgi:hypothetical protein
MIIPGCIDCSWNKQLSTPTQSPTLNCPITIGKQRASQEDESHPKFTPGKQLFSPDVPAPDEDAGFAMRANTKNHLPTNLIRFRKTGIESTYMPGNSVPRFMISI